MTPNQQTAIIAAALSIVTAYVFRRRVFALSGTGIYFLSSILLVYVGVLIAPWTVEVELPTALPYVRWEYIRDKDVRNAIWLVGGGLALTLVGNVVAAVVHSMLANWKRTRWPVILATPPRDELGTSVRRLTIVSMVALFLTLLLFFPKIGVAATGLVNGYLRHDPTAQYDARFKMQETGLLYYTLVFNVLPFLSVVAWTGYRSSGRQDVGRIAMVMVPAAAFFLLVTFEKMSLVLYLIVLLAAHAIASASARSRGKSGPRFSARQLLTIVVISGSTMITLFYFQYAGLAVALSGEVKAPMTDIVRMAATNLFSRQSIQPMMYLRFYPDIERHYGFSNIGMLMSALGIPFYSDTIAVLRFFSIYDFGSTSIGALGDFYGAFGWNGFIVGSLMLGGVLHWVDASLASLRPSALAATLAIFWMTVAYYLSQAAVVRCLSSYGGGAFLLLFLILTVRDPHARAAPAHQPYLLNDP